MARTLQLALPVFLLISFASGCSTPIGLREIDDSDWFERENRNALESSEPSERTLQFLRREGELERFQKEPMTLLSDLYMRLLETREREIAFFLAELCYRQGKEADEEEEQVKLFLSSVRFAYAGLFDESLAGEASAYDPSFRWMCDFYNRSLAKVLSVVRERRVERRESGDYVPGKSTLPVIFGEVEISLGVDEHHFDPIDYDDILIGFNYETVGLPGSARSYGLGVPLILVRAGIEGMFFRPLSLGEDGEVEDAPDVQIEQSFAATSFIRFGSEIGEEYQTAQFELFDPSKTSSIEVNDHRVPLEIEMTSALAYTLGKGEEYSGIAALLNTRGYSGKLGLQMIQPYDPEKIPVVFVHGLMSSPMTWMTLFNDLLADRDLRYRYQFWFFRYPTGNPILYSASLLRETLLEVQKTYDPEGNNRAFNHMLICGHSMGGLLTKFQILEGGDKMWNLLSPDPLDEIDVGEEDRELLRKILYYKRLPFITRAVFMATPHRGADMATSWYSSFASSLISLPNRVLEGSMALTEALGDRLRTRLGEEKTYRPATGITGLRGDSLISSEIGSWPLPVDIPFHCIIGNEEEAGVAGGSDGLVAYESSHLDGAQSEKIVRAGHNVQEFSRAILEVRRILHLHLGVYDSAVIEATE